MIEKKGFQLKTYQLKTKKLPEGKQLRLAILADLHGVDYGDEYERLFQTILLEAPDVVLLAGDMICRRKLETAYRVEPFLGRLAHEFPVFYGMGNHETSARERHLPWYREYEKRLMREGVRFLHNDCENVNLAGKLVRVFGLELPGAYYQRLFSPKLSLYGLTRRLGDPNPEELTILLAHTPMFAQEYFLWGADLTVCGHYHGGICRFSEHVGAISPQLHPFPAHCCGFFQEKEQHLVVSAGMGEHTMPLRIHNPRELLLIDLFGANEV